MPAAELQVDEDLVRALLAEQHPDLADRPLHPVASGWDNAIFRLGDDLAVRLPRRELAVPLIAHEQRWLPHLAPSLPLPIPAPVRVGRAGAGYPWPWSVCPWFHGASALTTPLVDAEGAARSLGAFLAALHQPAPADAPANPYRGIPLAERAHRTVEALDRLEHLDRAAVLTRWEALSTAPAWDGPPLWLHGDVHPGNLLVADGGLVAVIDFGDLTAGDPATDLAVAWMLLPARARPALRAAYGEVDDATWQRAQAWALALGLAIAASSADNPPYAQLADRTITAALADEG